MEALSMYTILLFLHSWLRWGVLIFAVFTLYRSFTGWQQSLAWTDSDKKTNTILMGLLHAQLLLGLLLYFVASPIVAGAMQDFGAAMKNKTVRFWAVEHITGMVIGIVIAQIGSIKAKKQASHKTAFIWFATALLIIVMTLPYEAGRYFRF